MQFYTGVALITCQERIITFKIATRVAELCSPNHLNARDINVENRLKALRNNHHTISEMLSALANSA